MRRIGMALAVGLTAALTWVPGARGQATVGAWTVAPDNGVPRPYAIGPMLPGSGGTYSYMQQSAGGTSPTAYYSANFFTHPSYRPAPYTYTSAYAGYYAPTYRYGYASPYYGTTYAAPRGGPLRRMFGR